jgi:bifunctional non-homologous end joining protein LigD
VHAKAKPGHPLAPYWSKRDFAVTAEPRGEQARTGPALSFVVQKHAASRLHYDFRLELQGVLVSWAVPKGPSLDPADKRLAVHVEDHPLSYGGFEGVIPPGQYGAGSVIVWDQGRWEPVGDARKGLAQGKLVFRLHGQKLSGLWELVRLAKKEGEKQEAWLLFKKRDEFARAKDDFDVVKALPDSVIAKPLRRAAAGAVAPGKRKAAAKEQTNGAAWAIPGAAKAALPQKLSPQLATLASTAPKAGQWVYESKFDGYRVMARIDGQGRARLITRGGHDWSAKLPRLVAALQGLGVRSAWLDGEIVLHGADGLPDFNALQNAFERSAPHPGIVYFLFDLPFLEGHDLRELPLTRRRELLKALLDGGKAARHEELLRFSESFEADAASILSAACKMNLEGVIAKRADSAYTPGRSESWLKLKCQQRQEFVVCGYTDRSDGQPQVGSLLLGVYGKGRGKASELVSVGRVGTGWTASEARKLRTQLSRLAVATSPFPAGEVKPGRWTKRQAEATRWVQPRLVAEVAFAGWTPDGQLRHASYVALRSDKPAQQVVREVGVPPAAGASAAADEAAAPAARARSRVKAQAGASKPTQPTVAGLAITHGDRVIDASTGLTKHDLVGYYASVADWMLPHLRGRPCALVRGPQGIQGTLFFQKHAERMEIPGVKELDPALDPGHASLLEVGSLQALVGAAQMNVIEFHTWGSMARHIGRPDRMVFDLDPGEGTAWPQVQEAALLVRGFLAELGLQSWLKTSGGKGLHVVVPLAPRREASVVKAFSKAIVEHLAKTIPSRFVAKSGPANRVGKLFIDYLRNGHGATTAAAFSARARPGLGVSMPVAWEELDGLKSAAQWNIANARERLSFQQDDPWEGYWKKRQALTGAMKAMGFKPAAADGWAEAPS